MPNLGRVCIRVIAAALLAAVVTPSPALAQSTPEYRAIWVETFNTPLGSRADIDKVIAAAVDARANAIFAQIRRRGDSWYLDTLEPLTQVANVGEPNAAGVWTLDPLHYLIEQAHLRGIEVHAFVIIGSIYNAHPTITGLPKDPAHIFNEHFWDKSAGALFPVTDPRQWSTRALPHNLTTGANPTTFNGHRFTTAGEWYVDLGHPDAQAYTVDVLTHLVRKYAVDGLHLDRIRYPEAPIDQPPGGLTRWGINVGYNETSVNRFKARYGASATYYTAADLGVNVSSAAAPAIIGAGDLGYPRTNDPLWNDWRREQVTNFVRRLYLSATAVNPRIKVSAALICFFTGPTGSGGWQNTEAHYRVFQDWRAWMQEGILDIAAPMIYKREHVAAERAQYDDWLAFTKSLAQGAGRHSLPGVGNFLNGVEGSLRQARRALARAPFAAGNTTADGVIFYALGTTAAPTPAVPGGSTSVNVTGNPFSYPAPGLNTPKRTNADFFAALRTSASANGTTLFEDPANGPLFPSPIPTPDMPWKSTPTLGHLMGFANSAAGAPLDGATMTLESVAAPGVTVSTARTDGGGFFGIVGVQPGTYRARVEQAGLRLDVCPFAVTAGVVASADARPDATGPITTGAVDPADATGANGWYLDDVRVTLGATDGCSGVARTEYSVDAGATWQTYSGAITLAQEGTTVLTYRSIDAAGNVEDASSITVRIDKSNPTLSLTPDRTILWAPNGKASPVVLTGSADDAVSGLASVTYEVVDEYALPFSIAPRGLTGASAGWSDTVALEARRDGTDLDGREYRVIATVRDAAGRTATVTVRVRVPHDRR